MRTRIHAAAAIALLSLSCTASAATENAPRPFAGPNELVHLVTADGPAGVDVRRGRVAFRATGAVARSDWSALFSTAPEAGGTVLHTLDPATGAEIGAVSLPGELSIRAVAGDGSKVALTAPPPPGVDPWTPVPRTRTTIVVADPSGAAEPERFRLRGNLEPEAFSNDGAHLFVIQYLPPSAPSLYRVAALELEDGDVYPVVSRIKTWSRRMPGTRLVQLPAPDGRHLYTLYSSQPAAYEVDAAGTADEADATHGTYAASYDVGRASDDRPIAFVHVLNLEDQWAFCLPLPRRLWDAPAGQQVMATSPDGSRLYVVDPSRDVVAMIGVRKTKVLETATVDLATDDTAHAAAVVSPDGATLYVGTGEAIVALDAGTLEIRSRWPTQVPVAALATSADGAVLYAAFPDRIDLLDRSTGTVQGSIPVAGTLAIPHVAAA